MKTFGAKDCQQIRTDGSRIVGIYAGPMIVRVHECRDTVYFDSPSRYYLSVDLKFKSFDALRDFGWAGYTKAEATAKAKALSESIAFTVRAIASARAGNLVGKDRLIKRQEQRLEFLVGKFDSTVDPAF